LEDWFKNEKKKIVSIEEKHQLARLTNLSINQVSFWIHNRSKKKKHKKTFIRKTNCVRAKNKKILLDYFKNINVSPSALEIRVLAHRTSLTERKIKYWFDKKRKSN
jgi:hypothetical protein